MNLPNDNLDKKPFKLWVFLKDNNNWLNIIAITGVYVILGFMEFEGGELRLQEFSNYVWFDWLIFIIITLLPPVIAISIYENLRKEGILVGEKLIQEDINNYYDVLREGNDLSKIVRSKKEFLSQQRKKSAAKNFSKTLIVSFISGQLFWYTSWDGIFKILINLCMWGAIGIQAYNSSREYATGELREWYILETARLKKLRYDEMVKSGKYLDMPGKDVGVNGE